MTLNADDRPRNPHRSPIDACHRWGQRAMSEHSDRIAYALTLPKGHPLRFMLLYGSNPSETVPADIERDARKLLNRLTR